jgi:hypothetical protein
MSRPAGTISFEGRFANGNGAGNFKFAPSEPFVRDMAALGIFGVTPDFIRKMEASGYKAVPVDKLIKIRMSGADDLVTGRR